MSRFGHQVLLERKGSFMTTSKQLKAGLQHIVVILSVLFFSSCYTVLKQSGEYYSEFGQNSLDTSDSAIEGISPKDSIIDGEETAYDEAENPETVIINRYYYDSPWWTGYGYGYPGRYWAVSVGYTWYPSYWYQPYDYYYWGGCYYPSYPGYYPYYPDPWYVPGHSYSSNSFRRNYGLRHDALNTSALGINRINSSNVTPVFSQRQYNTGSTAGSKSTVSAQTKKEIKETKKNRRRINTKTGNTASRPVEKRNTGNNTASGKREYKEVDLPKNNHRSSERGFENAKSHFARTDNQSSRSYNDNSSRSGNTSRSSGSRSNSPNVNSRTYNSKR